MRSRFARFWIAVLILVAPVAAQGPLNNRSIIKMIQAGLSEDVILSAIRQHPEQYALETDDLVSLRDAGVSNRIIEAMLRRRTASVAPASAPAAAAAPVVPVQALPSVAFLRDGTPVRLRLGRNLSSAETKAGETVEFEVLDEVKVGELTVIAKGGTAFGAVTEAQPQRSMGRGGKLKVNIDQVRLINGDKAVLRAVKEGQSQGRTGAAATTTISFFAAVQFMPFKRGNDIAVPKGTEVTVYVDGDHKFDPNRMKAPAAP